ncbi:MAG: AbrB family transcriptional regulator [Pseudomonadota bacterium]
MAGITLTDETRSTARALAAGVAGAGAAHLIGVPAAPILGPALLISALAAAGVRFAIAAPVRDAALLVLGIGVGAGVDEQATAAMARWPIAFAALAATLTATLFSARFVLTRFFGFDRRSATLAAAPGHLSFVIGLGEATGADLTRVTVVQTVRLLALTIVTPFAALAFGVEVDVAAVAGGPAMAVAPFAAVVAGSAALGFVLRRYGTPAPMLIGAMIVSAGAHVGGAVKGGLGPELALAGFVVVGSLIGARFSGITLAALRSAAGAGLAATAIAAGLAVAAAAPVALIVRMPAAHVMVGFAPGGLETMIALGAVLAASPGFVAACHVGRLLLLSILIPLVLFRGGKEG